MLSEPNIEKHPQYHFPNPPVRGQHAEESWYLPPQLFLKNCGTQQGTER